MRELLVIAILSLSSACVNDKDGNSISEEILRQLDDKNRPYLVVKNLDCDYADLKLSLFANRDSSWAIIISGYTYSSSAGAYSKEYICYGDDYATPDEETIFFDRVEELNTQLLDTMGFLKKDLPPSVSVEGKEYAINAKEISTYFDGKLDEISVLRYLLLKYPELVRYDTQKYLRKIFVFSMDIDEWHHKDFQSVTSYETYQMVVDVLKNRDTTKWKPSLAPNTHWKFHKYEDE